MAVSREGNVIVMSADGDEVEGKLVVQGLYASGAVAGVADSDDNGIATFGAAQAIQFPCKIFTQGIKRGAGAGNLYVYIV